MSEHTRALTPEQRQELERWYRFEPWRWNAYWDLPPERRPVVVPRPAGGPARAFWRRWRR